MAPGAREAKPLPTSGALTFLFTDIEGSTRKAHELGDHWFEVLQAHHDVLRPVFAAYGGAEVSTAGDSFFLVFEDAAQAVEASVAMQRAIAAHDWSPSPPVKVRMGMHTGIARFRDDDYAGLTVHAASRVESAAAGAQVLITQATLDAAEATLGDDIGVVDLGFHRLKDLPSELQIYQVTAAGLEREFPVVRGIDVVRNNVPVPPSSFVGRTTILTRLHQMLEDDRLVTIVGPGGTGKTRVSLRLATERLHRHSDGVWFVELDPAQDEIGVVTAIANVLGVREERDRPLLDSVIEYVRDTNVLFVIDNCEHVIDHVARVVEQILRSGTGVRVLATSREPIEIAGERTWPLAPLAVDDDDPASSEAVQLLVERVTRVQPDFALTAELVPAAATIARRLDGLPLALELAAASASMLPLDDIARQLDDRFDLLTRGSRTALDRQKTLWGAIDWSYGLLDTEARAVFRRVGVFPAEFDFGVADSVCADPTRTVAESLHDLMRKSLVTEGASTRLRLLESIRAYARERLAEEGELEKYAERHARHFVDSVVEAELQDAEWFDTIHEDFVAALRWGAEHDQDVQLRALVELQEFWIRRGRWTEGREISREALDATHDVQTKARWRALGKAGELASNQGDIASARAYFEQAAEVASIVGGPAAAQLVLGDLGDIAAREGDFETAEAMYRRSLDAARVLDKKPAIALCFAHLAQIASLQGDLDRAWNDGLDALAAARELEWVDLELSMTSVVGGIARQRGDLDEARRIYTDAMSMARKYDNRQSLLYALFGLAEVELDAGAPTTAAPLLRDALLLGQELGAEEDLREALGAAARLAVLVGQPDAANAWRNDAPGSAAAAAAVVFLEGATSGE
ncbi:MAG: tetratricopeptide repeat protein [Actinobacteria bacterium]|nr:tetratricopeptide repeat protein [Actinomycetota bacterium]